MGKREEFVRKENQELNELAVITQIFHNTKTRSVLWNLIDSQNMVFWVVMQNVPILGTKPTFSSESAVNHENRNQIKR
jgi:hypothetical protein